MKVTIDIDCTPEEARTFMGLPDVQPMQQRLLEEMEERMGQNVRDMEPEAMMNKWLPLGMQGMESMQKALWSAMTNAGKTGAGKTPPKD